MRHQGTCPTWLLDAIMDFSVTFNWVTFGVIFIEEHVEKTDPIIIEDDTVTIADSSSNVFLAGATVNKARYEL